MAPYSYPEPNSALIKAYNLEEHPEGGFFVQTEIIDEKVPSPYADGASRSLATQIYYLLSPASGRGRMHMNKSATFHLHHAGRAVYTLVNPQTSPPEIKRVVMGPDSSAGELKQLFVGGGWWKASELPEEDLRAASEDEEKKERTGCLISEVVVPGFHWEDHAFLDEKGLKELAKGDESLVEVLKKYVRPTRGQ